MKVLVNIPSLKHLGGVANHYFGLQPYWTESVLYNIVGRRGAKGGSGKYWLPWDIVKFIFRLITFRPDVVLVNPSLGINALKRDFIFLNTACKLGFRVAVFIHGFNWDVAKTVDRSWIAKNLNHASLIFVLARSFKDELERWGVTTRIVLSTTKVMDTLVEGYDITQRTGEAKDLLFLSRIERAKGIYEAVDTYVILKRNYESLTLTFVGDGSELEALKKYVAEKEVPDVRFTGGLSGDDLKREYVRANLFFFTSYGEGMPTVVLEAMAFGLPIITRSVGGLCDFFEDGKMGHITDSLAPEDFAEALVPYIEDPVLTYRVSNFNHAYATKHFMASHVAREMENQLKQIIC